MLFDMLLIEYRGSIDSLTSIIIFLLSLELLPTIRCPNHAAMAVSQTCHLNAMDGTLTHTMNSVIKENYTSFVILYFAMEMCIENCKNNDSLDCIYFHRKICSEFNYFCS